MEDAIAILAGDALLTRAFEMVSLRSPGVDPNRLLNVVGELSLVAGAPGLVGGQVVDLECEGKEVDLKTLEYIHLHKTGALLKACVRTGAMIAGANEKLLKALTTYAELSLIHISEPTRQAEISYAVFCLKKKTN